MMRGKSLRVILQKSGATGRLIARSLPLLTLIYQATSERDSSAYLNGSRSIEAVSRVDNKLLSDDAKCGRICQIERRISKVDMIENIEKVEGQRKTHPLCNLRLLTQRKVGLPSRKAAQLPTS